MNIHLYQITLAIAILLIGVEIFTNTFVFLGFAIGMFVLVPVHYFSESISIGRDSLIFSITAITSFFILRRVFLHKKDVASSKEDVNQY